MQKAFFKQALGGEQETLSQQVLKRGLMRYKIKKASLRPEVPGWGRESGQVC